MRYTTCYLLAFMRLGSVAQPQPISLQMDQFIDEHGQPFFPMIMNYFVEYAGAPLPSSADPTAAELSNCHIERASAYGLHGDYGYASLLNGQDRVFQDFYEMKLLGFNTVRLVMTPGKKFGTGFLIRIKDFPGGGWGQLINMDPPYDPAVNIVAAFHMGKVLQVCSLAQALDLKILLITADNQKFGFPELIRGNAGSPSIADYGKYLEELTEFLLVNGVSNVLAFDLYGEPGLSETGTIKPMLGYDAMHTKRQVCAIVDQWVSNIKQKDPDRLVTIGNYPADVYAGGWDPTMTKIDFATIHLYPKQNEWEEALGTGTFRQKCIDRYKDEIYIMDRTLQKPFVIAETGYAGREDYGSTGTIVWPISVYGNEADQEDFFQQTFQVIRDSRACGYAWWDFQDKHWWSDTWNLPSTLGELDKYKEDFWGPINWGNPSTPDYANGISGYESLRKDMGNTMASFAINPPPHSVPAFGPVSSTVDMSEIFYNPYAHPTNSTTAAIFGTDYHGTVTGHVEDLGGTPLSSARIQGTCIVDRVWNTGSLSWDEIQHGFHTCTDENGDFEIRGFDTKPGIGNPINPDKDRCIMDLKIGIYGAGQQEYGDWDSSPLIVQNTTYSLESFVPQFYAEIGSWSVGLTANETFSGTMTLTATDFVVEGNNTYGGVANLKATYEVSLSESHAQKGSEVHVYCEPVYIACDDIPVDMRAPVSSSTGGNAAGHFPMEQSNYAEIWVHPDIPATSVAVTPNPTDGVFTILITSELGSTAELTIVNSLGALIADQTIAIGATELDLFGQPSGVYSITVRVGDAIFNRRIVLH